MTIPSDIIIAGIFPKLPVKSLVRFKCVSKSFKNLISSPEFIDLNLRQSLSSDSNRILILSANRQCKLYSINADSLSPATIVAIPPQSIEDCFYTYVSIVGSINGLLCLQRKATLSLSDEPNHVIINPSTGVYREIIPHNSRSDNSFAAFGFGFDDIKNDYKLVRVWLKCTANGRFGNCLYTRKVMVYSLNENAWKLVEDTVGPFGLFGVYRTCVLMKNNLLHWLLSDSNNRHWRICCFDARFDKWANDLPLMDFDNEGRDKMVPHVGNPRRLGVLGGCLCVITSNDYSSPVVWIMKEYGVKESWIKLVEIWQYVGVGGRYYVPFGFSQRSKDEVLVRNKDRLPLVWCDIESETCGRTKEINGVPDFDEAYFLVGSLVPIPGGEKIQPSLAQK